MTTLQTGEVKQAAKNLGWQVIRNWCASKDNVFVSNDMTSRKYSITQKDSILLFCHNEIIPAIEKLGYWWDYSSEISTFTIETEAPVVTEARGTFHVACIRAWNTLNKTGA